jgi:hypothetical protein
MGLVGSKIIDSEKSIISENLSNSEKLKVSKPVFSEKLLISEKIQVSKTVFFPNLHGPMGILMHKINFPE